MHGGSVYIYKNTHELIMNGKSHGGGGVVRLLQRYEAETIRPIGPDSVLL